MTGPGPVLKSFKVPVDYARPIKVICIGAGISGILCGIRFKQRIPNQDWTIYDKNDEVGGVWYENRYPPSFQISILLTFQPLNCIETNNLRYPGVTCGMNPQC
jgi:cation diffusion facilitator CzcD-associated flavoprotein CzcO